MLISVLLTFLITQASAQVFLELSTKGDSLAFDKKIMQVQVGELVKLTFENKSKSIPHNLVILERGADPIRVGQLGLYSGRREGFIPPSHLVLFASRLLDGGEHTLLEFRAPLIPGDYPYVCTFPGHAEKMNGILKVIK